MGRPAKTREDIVKRLDDVTQKSGRRHRAWLIVLGSTTQRRGHYEELKRVLLEADGVAVNALIRMSQVDPFRFINTLRHVRNPPEPSCAPCPSRARDIALGKSGITSSD